MKKAISKYKIIRLLNIPQTMEQNLLKFVRKGKYMNNVILDIPWLNIG